MGREKRALIEPIEEEVWDARGSKGKAAIDVVRRYVVIKGYDTTTKTVWVTYDGKTSRKAGQMTLHTLNAKYDPPEHRMWRAGPEKEGGEASPDEAPQAKMPISESDLTVGAFKRKEVERYCKDVVRDYTRGSANVDTAKMKSLGEEVLTVSAMGSAKPWHVVYASDGAPTIYAAPTMREATIYAAPTDATNLPSSSPITSRPSNTAFILGASRLMENAGAAILALCGEVEALRRELAQARGGAK